LNLVGTAQNCYERGLAKYETGEFQEAVKRFRQAVSLSPFFPEAHFYLGLALVSPLGGKRKAEARVRVYWPKLNDESPLGGKDKGQVDEFELIKWSEPNIEQAIAAFRTAVQQRDDYPEAHLYLGLALWPYGEGESSEVAKSEIEKAVLLRCEGFPGAHFALGFVLWREGKWDEMKAAFRLALSQDPTLRSLLLNPMRYCFTRDPGAQWGRASLLKLLGEHEQAATAYQECLASPSEGEAYGARPISIDARESLGDVYWAMGNHRKAITEYQTAIKLAEDSKWDFLVPGVRYKLGQAYKKIDLHEEAIRQFQAAIRGHEAQNKIQALRGWRKESWWEVHYWLSCAMWLSGRRREAVDEFSIALQQGCAESEAGQARQCIRDYLVTLKDVQRLISCGKRRGYLGYQEIKNLVPDIARSAQLMKVLVNILKVQEGVKVLARAGDDRTDFPGSAE